MKKFLSSYFPVLIMAAVTVVGIILIALGVFDINKILQMVDNNRFLVIAVIMLLFALKGIASIVIYNVLVVAVGLMFDLRESIIISCVGLIISLAVAYFMGYITDWHEFEEKLSRHARLSKWFGYAKEYGVIFCFLTHAVGLPIELLGLIYGMLRLPFLQYMAASFLAVLPMTLCMILLGGKVSVYSSAFWAVIGIEVAVIIVSAFVLKRKMAAHQDRGGDAKTSV